MVAVPILQNQTLVNTYLLMCLELIKAFPMTEVGKIDKKELRWIIAQKLQEERTANRTTIPVIPIIKSLGMRDA